ncbi:hypothetical protein AN640_08645 [Candidatus Epulonipiscium fishelsonii]|uniref:Uncharacterized protein n=1 Tax=Candidatus Epulonipiscium fishelsonii TaxID=77094 RepID=A0ACC8XCX7_9FIRM|nr:hypothetical protein AN640_08645 [Epulopiscium sp. SCG-D08WGA-EpuloA1]OON96313.1 MAG: hypothetical protein ATN32_06485 [Epulopiscium sp. AS2M-Bin002]
MKKNFLSIYIFIAIILLGIFLNIIKFEEVFSNIDLIENAVLEYVPNSTPSDELEKITTTGENIFLTQYGSEQLNLFIENFYNDYHAAILNSNYGHIIEYLSETSTINIYNDFNAWFIKNKNIDNIEIEVELGEINFNQNNNLVLDITETIILDNRNDDKLTTFKIYLTWQTEVDINNYKIEDRTLTESLVSYLKDNEWVTY